MVPSVGQFKMDIVNGGLWSPALEVAPARSHLSTLNCDRHSSQSSSVCRAQSGNWSSAPTHAADLQRFLTVRVF